MHRRERLGGDTQKVQGKQGSLQREANVRERLSSSPISFPSMICVCSGVDIEEASVEASVDGVEWRLRRRGTKRLVYEQPSFFF